MLHIYYGYGRGKTSTLNGTAIRAIGAGFRVGIFRFLKGRPTSEDIFFKKHGIEVIKFQSSKKFVIEMNSQEKIHAKEETISGMKHIIANKDRWDLLILDEFIDLVDKDVNFLTEEEIIDFLKQLSNLEVLVSGHREYKKIINFADLVTKYTAEKHYFSQGIQARVGIEK